MQNEEAIVAEEKRQAQLFLNAFQEASKSLSTTLACPMITALATAIAMFEGAMLTAIPAGRHREEIRDMMRRVTIHAIAQNEGKTKQVQVVKAGALQ